MTAPAYSVVVRDFLDSASDDYSPGDAILFVDNPHNLAWTEYVNEVGEAFWSMSQHDYKASGLAAQESVLNLRPHVQIYRDADLVWGGWLGEIDETETDVVFYAYSYLSGFFDIVTAYDTEYVGQTIDAIVNDTWNDALAKDRNRVHWLTKSIVNNPWTTSDGAVGITMPIYRAPYKRVLTVWKELAAYAISDTTNHVIFEITPAGVFNFHRNKKNTASNVKATYGGGAIRSYRRIRRPVARRNILHAVGTSPTDVNLNISRSSDTLLQNMGRSEEPIYFSFVRDSDELLRTTLLRVARAARVDTDLYVSFHRDSIVPFRATGADYDLGDIITINLVNGISNTSETKVVVGQQVVYNRMSENVRLLLADRL